MTVSRAFVDALTGDVAATRNFSVELLGLRTAFDSDRFVNLTPPGPDSEAGQHRARSAP